MPVEYTATSAPTSDRAYDARIALSVVFNVTVNLLFYSTKDLVDFAVVFFVVAADLADECHQYKETTTDERNHNFSCHFIQPTSRLKFLHSKSTESRH